MVIGLFETMAQASLSLMSQARSGSRVVIITTAARKLYLRIPTSFILQTVERLVDRYIRNGPLSRKPSSGNKHGYLVTGTIHDDGAG